MSDEKEFSIRYEALLRHYRLAGQKIQAGKANENGDVAQRHHRLKRALDQVLPLRGSRDFGSVADYKTFLGWLLAQLNAGRRERLAVEMQYLRVLPERWLESAKRVTIKVDSGIIRTRLLRNLDLCCFVSACWAAPSCAPNWTQSRGDTRILQIARGGLRGGFGCERSKQLVASKSRRMKVLF